MNGLRLKVGLIVFGMSSASLAVADVLDAGEDNTELFMTKSVVNTVYFERSTGELAGMNNTILKPNYILGIQSRIIPKSMPDWHSTVDVWGIYGAAVVGNEQHVNPEWLEVRAKVTSLYTVYNNSDILTFNTGLYGLFAYPRHNYPPYENPIKDPPYAQREWQTLSSQQLLGIDANFDVKYDKSVSSFHNVVYVHGARIGPNLLTYQPTLGFDWRHEIFFSGTKDRPKFSFVANVQFWFAQKAHTALFNMHDGIGGTKRELFLLYGINYFPRDHTAVYLESYGTNNLNRGESTTDPKGFRDGAILGVRHTY